MTTPIDVFGNIVDASTVETALAATLAAWLPDHLAHQQRRRGLPHGSLPVPTRHSVSEFDLAGNEHLPAIFIVSTGSVGTPERDHRGNHRKTWRFEIAVVVAGTTEDEARLYASLELAAIIGALVQGDPTLGGVAENTRNVGPDDHAYGTTDNGDRRAIYGTPFEVTVRNAINDRLGPLVPSPDPEHPIPYPDNPLEADITVTVQEATP